MSHVSESGKSSYVLHDESGKKYVVSDDSNGDVAYHSGDEPYPEMTKEHLLRHSSKPLWRTLRTISIAIIIISWLALIAATIAIIVIHPRCKETPVQKWWEKSTIYRIYIRSFLDSNGDGVGDLNGVSLKLDYLKSLGIDTISLSPFYEHNQSENEFSILNHTAVDSNYGTLKDYDDLVASVRAKGMHLILDFIPGTTSDAHPWFTESSKSDNRSNIYRNYYTWNADADLPNNWLTIYSGGPNAKQSAWTQVSGLTQRNGWYLHQFLPSQPSLNLRNYAVQAELESILQFWLERGADGFYIRNSAYLFVDPDFPNEEPNPDSSSSSQDDYDFYKHERTFGLPEINDMFSRWRYLLGLHPNEKNESRLLFADIPGSTEQNMLYYGRYGRDGVDFPLGNNLLMIKNGCNGVCVKKLLDEVIQNVPENKTLSWRVGSEDTTRLEDRTNGTLSRSLTLLSMLLRGTAVSYYGDEIGMSDSPISPTNMWSVDQPMRSPMQWANQTHGGFVSNCSSVCKDPWLPVNGDYSMINVEMQTSEIAFYQKLITLRQYPSVQYGKFTYFITNENIVSFMREFGGQTNILVAINFGTTEVKQDFRNEDITKAMVEIATHPGDMFIVGESILLDGVTLKPGEGVVLSWDYVIEQY